MLRPYQQAAVDAAVEWVAKSPARGGVIVAPTGSGKSHILAAICQNIPAETLVVILTPSQEIVAQDARIMDAYGIRAGVCCAGLKRHDIPTGGISVIIATPGSFRPDDIPADLYTGALVIIDEAHRVNVSHAATETMFRGHIDAIRSIWPATPLIGLTATPWRLGQGDIIGGDIWHDIIYHIRTDTLIHDGHLVPITPYARMLYSDDELKSAKSGGEYSLGALGRVLAEKEDDGGLGDMMDVIARIMNTRKHALVYCPTIDSAEIVCGELTARGVACDVVSQKTPANERKQLLDDFKTGKIEALCNCAILTTGFDAPVTDLVVLLIATASRAKYYQILGRGMRPAPGKTDCLLLDGGGNVLRHGLNPDLEVQPALVSCTQCGRIIPLPTLEELTLRTTAGNFVTCPECGARYLACRVCGHIWIDTLGMDTIVCPRCRNQVYPPIPSSREEGEEEISTGGGGQTLQLEIPYRYGTQIRTESGKVFSAISPISLHKYVSRTGKPCVVVKNAFRQWAYIILTDAGTRASMGYICNGIRTRNHRIHAPPTPEEIWMRCKNPTKKVIAVAGFADGKFPRITHILIFSPVTGYESVEIRRNHIQPEIVIPPAGREKNTKIYQSNQ